MATNEFRTNMCNQLALKVREGELPKNHHFYVMDGCLTKPDSMDKSQYVMCFTVVPSASEHIKIAFRNNTATVASSWYDALQQYLSKYKDSELHLVLGLYAHYQRIRRSDNIEVGFVVYWFPISSPQSGVSDYQDNDNVSLISLGSAIRLTISHLW